MAGAVFCFVLAYRLGDFGNGMLAVSVRGEPRVAYGDEFDFSRRESLICQVFAAK